MAAVEISHYGRVQVEYSSFHLLADANTFSGLHWETSFVTARDGYFSIYSRSNDHHTAVRTVYTESRPDELDLSRWDSVIEGGIDAAHPLELILPSSPSRYGLDSDLYDLEVPAGQKLVRVAVRVDESLLQAHLSGEAKDAATDPRMMPEQFLIEIWNNESGETVTGTQIK